MSPEQSIKLAIKTNIKSKANKMFEMKEKSNYILLKIGLCKHMLPNMQKYVKRRSVSVRMYAHYKEPNRKMDESCCP